jgi:hypothetical protein
LSFLELPTDQSCTYHNDFNALESADHLLEIEKQRSQCIALLQDQDAVNRCFVQLQCFPIHLIVKRMFQKAVRN